MALPSSNNGDADDELAKEIDRIKTAEEVEERTAEAAATFGYRYDSPEDREEISMQRRAAWDWVKTVGMKILEGSNLTQISLPVRLFEPRSFLERLTDNWSYIDYLSKAAVCTDPVLRFKYVIAFAVSGLSKQTTAGKPFNPILGETYQAAAEHRSRQRERLFTRETVIGDEAAHWVEVTSADGAPETEKGLSALAQVSHDLVAICALQQEEILHLQQTVDQMLARLQALEKQPAAVAAAGPSTLTTRVQVLEDDVSNIKRVHQDFGTSQQATNLQLETQVQAAATVTPAAASSRRPPKLDDIPVFCDQSKTEPIPWWSQFTLRLDMHHVPNNDRHPCLYHRSGGACQAWLDNILTSHGVAVSELHTKLTWQELTDAWRKRFQVEPPNLQAMDKLNKLHQSTLLSQDSITELQRLASTPDLPLAFRAIKHLFIMRSCPALQNALTQIAETLDTSDKLFSTASRIILTNIEARNAGRSSATTSGTQPKPKVACITSTEAATPNEGEVLAAAWEGGRPRNNHGRDKTKTESTSTPSTGSAADEPWAQYGLSANSYCTRLKYHEVAVGDMLGYVAKVAREFVSQRKKVPPVHSIDDARKKELLAFVHALKRWRHFLLGREAFRWVTDNNPLVFYKSQDTIKSTITRWMAFIDQFDFFPDHIPGKSNHFADALSRRPDLCTAVYSTFEIDDDLRESFIRGYQADPHFRDKYANCSSPNPVPSHYRIQEGYLLVHSRGKDLLCVPNDLHLRTRLLGEFHNVPASGHFGVIRTLGRLRQRFYWPDLLKDATRYCESFEVCRRCKARNHRPFGELHPLPVPFGRQEAIAMDITGPFPKHKTGVDGILTVVDRLTKYAMFLSCRYHAKAPELAEVLYTGWIRSKGYPKEIVCDRDTRFLSDFWVALVKRWGSSLKPSSARHPQTDGQTERAHQTAQVLLRTLIRPDQFDWVERLPDVELAYNSSIHPAIGMLPFEFEHGSPISSPLDATLSRTAESDDHLAFLRRMQELLVKARDQMSKTQIRMSRQANRNRLPCPFRAGDLVWVSAAEFSLEQDISRKLLPKWMWPWRILSAAGDDPEGPSLRIAVLDNEGLYAFTGEGSWSAAARGNSVRGQQGGWNRVRFASDAAEVAWELPGILLRGILWGERVLLYTGVMRFVDEKNNLSCSLSFDPDMEKCSFFTKMFKQRRLPDLLRGDIIRRSPLNGGTQSAEVTKLGTIEGVWLTHLDCDGKRLWDIKTAVAVKPEPVDNPLPSDCRFRQDLIALKAKDYDAAQTWKEKLENIQRADRALRREGLKERQSRKPAEASTAVVGAVGSVLQCARPVVERSLLCAQATGG
ncbi:hypothetical protein CBR_g41440 [Chara braunii]|uniref:Integrase catalytic domain-containing protein n=1 Tax=Chara braunii TaxID=69332 RepID=A0A388LVU1_CHABU|nr:hypothetical protein CBR_g41440 [Chara braunii]|eukprot:GBG86444.1 hypothetical protein CBR_g41440 [Chara braunii]